MPKTKRSSSSSSKRRSSSKKSSSSYLQKWSKMAPKSTSERRQLKKKCGSKCFLMPGKMKFPICKKCVTSSCTRSAGGCKVSKKALISAYVRARQWGYPQVAATAKKLRRRMRRKTSFAGSYTR